MSEIGVEDRVLTRVCGRCSVQSQTSGDFCPNCGRSYVRRGLSKRTKLIAVGVVVLVLLGGGAAGAVAKVRHDRAAEAAQAAAAQKAADEVKAKADAKAAAAQKAAAERAANNAERRDRRQAVKEMERTIAKDARKDVASGLLAGPIFYTTCDPLGGGSTDDLTALTTTFSCLAVTKKNNDGTASGYAYHATMNWSEGSYSWGIGNS